MHRKKACKVDLAKLHKNPGTLPRQAIFLDPFAEAGAVTCDNTKNGIVVLDCSWVEVERVFPILQKLMMKHRALPFLLAAMR